MRSPSAETKPAGEGLALILAALANDDRRAILEYLGGLERAGQASATVTSIALGVGVSRFLASHHLAVLRHSGLVLERREGTKRLHAIETESLHYLEDWILRFFGD